jgi:ribonuclease G
MNKLVVTNYKNRYLEAFFEDDRLMDLKLYDKSSELGSIYVGRVANVIPNLNACFVDYGESLPAYYSLTENKHIILNSKKNAKISIGDELLIQISKEAIKTKNPVATAELSLKGEYVIVTVGGNIGISSKIKGSKRREELKNLAASYLPKGMGCIVRTNAENAGNSEIEAEINRFVKRLNNILEVADKRTCFSCIYKNNPEYIDSFIVKYNTSLEKVISDDPEVIEDFQRYMTEKSINDVELTFYQDETLSLMSLFDLNKELQGALNKKVWLKSGGYLVVEQTEALSVIDVNTGKAIKGKSSEENFLRINKEAALEACRQLRLRNISGIIIIDFINMADKRNMDIIREILEKELSKDYVPAKFVDVTRLELVEITRKKIRKSLGEVIKE